MGRTFFNWGEPEFQIPFFDAALTGSLVYDFSRNANTYTIFTKRTCTIDFHQQETFSNNIAFSLDEKTTTETFYEEKDNNVDM